MTTKCGSFWVETEDWHTAGEPFRVVRRLPPGHEVEGHNVRQRRLNITETPGHPLDLLRQSLCHEPRGHADMYGGFIVPSDDSGALFGVLFWHKDGFSTACGHGTIALGYWAIAHKMLPVPDNGEVDVVIDVPSGRVKARMAIRDGEPIHAEFINVLSYQVAKNLSAHLQSYGVTVEIDLVFAGAVYATIDADQIGLKVEPQRYADFIDLGREVKKLLGEQAHYSGYDLYCVIFYNEENSGLDEGGIVRQRNVTIFADGQIDRSPCGTGTCARLAVLLSQGRVGTNRNKLLHRGIVGTTFEADVLSEEPSPVPPFKACIPRVRGQANLLGQMKFYIDPSEPVFPGFLLR